MAQLSSLVQFTAGTPAIAADVNQNFTDIRNHINGANIDTENIAATLTSRTGGPILFLNQASQNQVALAIQNSQTNTAMQILQSAVLADNSKAVLKIESPSTQTTGKAELWLSLAGGSTIPAILVEHGANTTMSLTSSQLNLFNSSTQITSNDIISTALLTLTSRLSDALVVKIKGRSNDNTSKIEFKSNDDATVYGSITSSSSGLALNLPDTADSYTFNVNGVTKAFIDNNGIDGQYIKTTSIPKQKMVALGQQAATPPNFTITASGGNPTQSVGPTTVTGATITLTTTGRPVLVSLDGYMYANNGGTGAAGLDLVLYLFRNGVEIHNFPYRDVGSASTAGTKEILVDLGKVFLDIVPSGTYTYTLKLYAISSLPIGGGGMTANAGIAGIRLLAYEL